MCALLSACSCLLEGARGCRELSAGFNLAQVLLLLSSWRADHLLALLACPACPPCPCRFEEHCLNRWDADYKRWRDCFSDEVSE